MSTWRKRFSRKSQRLSANDEILLNNTVKYRKKLQTAITQINRTKKSSQHYYESPDSEIHVARLVNDIGQLSDCKSLQQISGLIDSLAMRHQLSSRIFNEYAMNSLQQSLQKLNEHISTDVDKTKSILDEAVTNHCSDHTKKQLFSKVKDEWSTHQKLATKELKQGLNSYCDIGLYHLKIQMAILEKLQSFVDQLPDNDNDDGDPNNELPNFHANSIQTRRDIDTMLRIMLDTAPNNSSALPANKRPKFLNDQLTLSNSLYSQEITEAAASSNFPSVGQRNPPVVLQYPSIPPSTAQTYASPNPTPLTPRNNNNSRDDDQLPSYTDLFVVPSSCKEQRRRRI